MRVDLVCSILLDLTCDTRVVDGYSWDKRLLQLRLSYRWVEAGRAWSLFYRVWCLQGVADGASLKLFTKEILQPMKGVYQLFGGDACGECFAGDEDARRVVGIGKFLKPFLFMRSQICRHQGPRLRGAAAGALVEIEELCLNEGRAMSPSACVEIRRAYVAHSFFSLRFAETGHQRLRKPAGMRPATEDAPAAF